MLGKASSRLELWLSKMATNDSNGMKVMKFTIWKDAHIPFLLKYEILCINKSDILGCVVYTQQTTKISNGRHFG